MGPDAYGAGTAGVGSLAAGPCVRGDRCGHVSASRSKKIVERNLPSSLFLDPNGADVVVSLDSSRYVRILPDCSRDAFSFQDGSFSLDSLVDSSSGSFQIDLPGSLDAGLQDSPRDPCQVFFADLIVPDPVRPGLISTHRSSPGSSSDLLTPPRPEDTAHRLPADLPPFHYSSLMTSHALNKIYMPSVPCDKTRSIGGLTVQ